MLVPKLCVKDAVFHIVSLTLLDKTFSRERQTAIGNIVSITVLQISNKELFPTNLDGDPAVRNIRSGLFLRLDGKR